MYKPAEAVYFVSELKIYCQLQVYCYALVLACKHDCGFNSLQISNEFVGPIWQLGQFMNFILIANMNPAYNRFKDDCPTTGQYNLGVWIHIQVMNLSIFGTNFDR